MNTATDEWYDFADHMAVVLVIFGMILVAMGGSLVVLIVHIGGGPAAGGESASGLATALRLAGPGIMFVCGLGLAWGGVALNAYAARGIEAEKLRQEEAEIEAATAELLALLAMDFKCPYAPPEEEASDAGDDDVDDAIESDASRA